MDDTSGESTVSSTPEVEQTQQTESTPVAAQTSTETTSGSDTKLYAVLGYILPFLFFLPLLSESTKNDPFAKFHANQQLNLFLASIALMVLNNILYLILYFIAFALVPLVWLGLLVLAIMGIISALHGEMKELPLIGKFRLLK